jgi:hypothetical protein
VNEERFGVPIFQIYLTVVVKKTENTCKTLDQQNKTKNNDFLCCSSY